MYTNEGSHLVVHLTGRSGIGSLTFLTIIVPPLLPYCYHSLLPNLYQKKITVKEYELNNSKYVLDNTINLFNSVIVECDLNTVTLKSVSEKKGHFYLYAEKNDKNSQTYSGIIGNGLLQKLHVTYAHHMA